ncbi:hypothetical protein B296_00057993 [Ensete ventricosum]|uniref:Uncharacterized protein n=1 Tax=Ensete ventricosum TaxID=4639 RepID=A0A426XC96_ENSVE|nr:hypothetical protein B296_00057993 [Ensete ventricosum]
MLSVTFYVFQLQKLKVEPVLLHYLSRMGALKGCKIYLKPSRDRPAMYVSRYTSSGFVTLYRSRIEDGDEYKAEGMPVQLHFPRRAHVSNKRCASCSLGYIGSSLPGEWVVSLVGRYPRHVISVFFRLLYPWYWPSSCWNFIVTCVTTVVYYVLRVIISSWDNIRKKI